MLKCQQNIQLNIPLLTILLSTTPTVTPNMISKGHLIFWPRPHVPYFSEFCLGVSLICPLNLDYQVGHPINFKTQMTPNNHITNQLVITHYNKAACMPYLRYFFLVLS